MRDQGPLREPHCRRILPALLPAAELLLRVLDLRLEHWESVFCKSKRDAVHQARCAPAQRFAVHGKPASERESRGCFEGDHSQPG